MNSATPKVHRFSTNLAQHVTKIAILMGLVAVVAMVGYASLQTTAVPTF